MTKLLQVFLSAQDSPTVSISEVSIDVKTSELFCTCPGFRGRKICKHVKEVSSRIEAFNGVYPMEFTDRAEEEEIINAVSGDEETLRKFILKYGKVEIL